jgi:plasmid stabilization system protein ParE
VSGYVLSREAEEDLFEIWAWLASEAGIEFADRVEENLFEEFERLSRNPGLGHQRPDLTHLPVLFRRAFPFQYLVIYRRRTPLEIVAVFHAKRDISAILGGRGQAEGPNK